MTTPVRTPTTVRVIAFLWGLQFSFLNPALALLLVSVFGASTGQVAGVLAIYNSSCLLTSFVIPRWADRHGDYVRPMIGCAAFTVALAASLWFVHSLPLAVVGLVLLGAPAAVGTPLLFGYIRHSGAAPSAVVRTRAVFSMSWVAGPPIASGIVSTAGGHALVLGVGAVGAVNIVAIAALLRSAGTARPVATAERTGSGRPLVAPTTLALVVVAFAGLQAANTTSVSVMTLFATRNLQLSPLWGGIALGVAAALEVPALLLLGRSGRRVSDLSVLSLACGLGVAYYLMMSVATSGAMIIAAQLLNASFYGVVAGVGLTFFQSIVDGPCAAAGLLSNAQRAGALLAGPIVGVGSIVPGGLRAVYVACAAVTALGLLLVRIVQRRLAEPAAGGGPSGDAE